MPRTCTAARSSLRLAVAATALGFALGTPVAQAGVVTTSANIPVPFANSFTFVNAVTGATGTSPPAVPGWDFSAGFQGVNSPIPLFGFFSGTAGDANRGFISRPFFIGETVSSANSFATGLAPFAPLATGTYYFGFRFTNEGVGLNYGYLTLDIASPLGPN